MNHYNTSETLNASSYSNISNIFTEEHPIICKVTLIIGMRCPRWSLGNRSKSPSLMFKEYGGCSKDHQFPSLKLVGNKSGILTMYIVVPYKMSSNELSSVTTILHCHTLSLQSHITFSRNSDMSYINFKTSTQFHSRKHGFRAVRIHDNTS